METAGVGGCRLGVERGLARVTERHQDAAAGRGLADPGDAAADLDLPAKDERVERRANRGVQELGVRLIDRGLHL